MREISLSQRLAIGVIDGAPAETFGQIADVAADGDGKIYVLDAQNTEVRVFDSRGRHLQTLGRQGGGPGEFEAPSALSVGPGDTLYVGDAIGRITAYRIADSLEHVADFRIDYSVRDLCSLERSLFVAGLARARVVHEYRIAGDSLEEVAAFGGSTAQPPLPVDVTMPNIACVPAAGEIVVTSGFYSKLEAYTTAGDSAWTSTLPDFRQMSITVRGPGYAFGFPEGERWHHALIGVIPRDDSSLLVQLRIRRLQGEPTGYEVRVTSKEGVELLRQEVPFELLFARAPLVYGRMDDPYPRVIVAEMR